MVRDLGAHLNDTLKEIKDNRDRIHHLRERVDRKVHDNKPINTEDLGELIQREVVTAYQANQVAEVARGNNPEQSVAYKQMAAQYLNRASGDMLIAGQFDQAQRYSDDVANLIEEIKDEMGDLQRRRREPSRENRGNARGYHGRDNNVRARTRERGDVSYNAAVGVIISGIIIMFLMGMPGITGAAIGAKIGSGFGVVGILLVLVGVAALLFSRKKQN